MSFHPETKNYKYWTTQEDQKLEELVKNRDKSFKEIGAIMNRTSQSCQDHAASLGLKNKYIHKLHSHDENFWSIPNALNCYHGGFCASDASLTSENSFRLEIHRSDRKHLEDFSKAVKYTGKIKDYSRIRSMNGKPAKEYFTSMLVINSCAKWKEDLKNNFNIVPNKTKTLAPPNLNDNYLKLCYLIGLSDGDGTICLTIKNGKPDLIIRWVSSSRSIIEWVKNIVDSMNLARRRNRENTINTSKNNKYFDFAISGTKAVDFVDRLKDFNVPKLSRKWHKPELLEYINKYKLEFPTLFKIV